MELERDQNGRMIRRVSDTSSPSVITARDTLKSEARHFPFKLYEMLQFASESDHGLVFSWTPDGRAFSIQNKDKFMDSIVPMFFKQTKFRSFVSLLHLLFSFVQCSFLPRLYLSDYLTNHVAACIFFHLQTRQLNLWGFQRIAHECPNKGAWYNEHFIRGHPDNLKKITRVEIKGSPKAVGSRRPSPSPLTIVTSPEMPADVEKHPVAKCVPSSINAASSALANNSTRRDNAQRNKTQIKDETRSMTFRPLIPNREYQINHRTNNLFAALPDTTYHSSRQVAGFAPPRPAPNQVQTTCVPTHIKAYYYAMPPSPTLPLAQVRKPDHVGHHFPPHMRPMSYDQPPAPASHNDSVMPISVSSSSSVNDAFVLGENADELNFLEKIFEREENIHDDDLSSILSVDANINDDELSVENSFRAFVR